MTTKYEFYLPAGRQAKLRKVRFLIFTTREIEITREDVRTFVRVRPPASRYYLDTVIPLEIAIKKINQQNYFARSISGR